MFVFALLKAIEVKMSDEGRFVQVVATPLVFTLEIIPPEVADAT